MGQDDIPTVPFLKPRRDRVPGNTISPARRLLSIREALWAGIATFLFVVVVFFTEPSILQSLDFILFWKPNFHFLTDAVREARLPLWNPYSYGSMPFIHDVKLDPPVASSRSD